MPLVLKSLLESRRFWLLVFGVVQSYVAYYMKVPEPLWQSIDALVIALITGITVEDSSRGFGEQTMATRVEIARINAGAVVSAASVTAKPSLASPDLVAEVPKTDTEKAATAMK